MKSLTRHTIRVLFVLWLGLILAKPALALLPASPPETATLQNVHQAGSGFLLIKHKYATFNISPYITIRYLNQKAIEDSYTDSFGRTFELDKRHDLIFQKVILYFKGWVASPDFRYFLYTWSSNANQEQGTQVVIGGNMQYQLSKYLDLGAGIGPLPTSRSVLGNWPFWLRQDARPMADEFLRGSLTMGIWAQGEIANELYYKTMLGNNLSQLGIDARQLDNGFATWSSSVWWTTNNFSRLATIGDYERHEKPATELGTLLPEATKPGKSMVLGEKQREIEKTTRKKTVAFSA